MSGSTYQLPAGIWGSPADRARDRLLMARAHLRTADHALRAGDRDAAMKALADARERMERAKQILEGQ